MQCFSQITPFWRGCWWGNALLCYQTCCAWYCIIRSDNLSRFLKKRVLIHFGEYWTELAIERGRFGIIKRNWRNGLRQGLFRCFCSKTP